MDRNSPPRVELRSHWFERERKREKEKWPNATKAIELMPQARKPLPLAHSLISAGSGVEVCDDGYNLLDVNELITKGREGFTAYIVDGDSQRPDIEPGYIVFVHPYAEPRNGNTIAVNINGENCIKIYQREESALRLVSRNPEYEPREVQSSDQLYLLGVVCGHLAVY